MWETLLSLGLGALLMLVALIGVAGYRAIPKWKIDPKFTPIRKKHLTLIHSKKRK